MNHLQTENLKLNSDVKVIRAEHSELLQELRFLKQKNEALQSENQALK